MKTKRKKLENLIEQIIECEDRTKEIWLGRKKFSVIHEDRLRKKIHKIHLVQEWLFVQLWDAYYDFPDEVEKIGKREYCDGIFHFKVKKNDDLKYGYNCDCEGE